jgi:hypothetical protein
VDNIFHSKVLKVGAVWKYSIKGQLLILRTKKVFWSIFAVPHIDRLKTAVIATET